MTENNVKKLDKYWTIRVSIDDKKRLEDARESIGLRGGNPKVISYLLDFFFAKSNKINLKNFHKEIYDLTKEDVPSEFVYKMIRIRINFELTYEDFLEYCKEENLLCR